MVGAMLDSRWWAGKRFFTGTSTTTRSEESGGHQGQWVPRLGLPVLLRQPDRARVREETSPTPVPTLHGFVLPNEQIHQQPSLTRLEVDVEDARPHKTRPSRRCSWLSLSRTTSLRHKVISSLLSGIILVVLLTIYLTLALSNRLPGQQYHVVLILFIILITIVFCHSLIRLCMLALTPSRERHHPRSRNHHHDYAVPTQPIQVVTRHDEEAVGHDSEAAKFPPPAYGLWRCSVRVDPNLLYWQRNAEANLQRNQSTRTARPPSYLSDEGVQYALDPEPESRSVGKYA